MPFLHGYILFLAYFSEANDKENDRKLNWSHGFIHSIFLPAQFVLAWGGRWRFFIIPLHDFSHFFVGD
jgi:hypothetical protein